MVFNVPSHGGQGKYALLEADRKREAQGREDECQLPHSPYLYEVQEWHKLP